MDFLVIENFSEILDDHVSESSRARKEKIQNMRTMMLRQKGPQFPAWRTPTMKDDERKAHKAALAGEDRPKRKRKLPESVAAVIESNRARRAKTKAMKIQAASSKNSPVIGRHKNMSSTDRSTYQNALSQKFSRNHRAARAVELNIAAKARKRGSKYGHDFAIRKSIGHGHSAKKLP